MAHTHYGNCPFLLRKANINPLRTKCHQFRLSGFLQTAFNQIQAHNSKPPNTQGNKLHRATSAEPTRCRLRITWISTMTKSKTQNIECRMFTTIGHLKTNHVQEAVKSDQADWGKRSQYNFQKQEQSSLKLNECVKLQVRERETMRWGQEGIWKKYPECNPEPRR